MTPDERAKVIAALELAISGAMSSGELRSYRLALAIMRSERETKLWLWKNFVDGRPEYWAFDNPFPVHLDCGDPQTLGEPCGYAIVKPSRTGRTDVSEAEVLRRIKRAKD